MNNDLAAAAEAGLNSLALDDGGVNEKPLSDAAFEAPKVEEKPETPEAKEQPAKLSTRQVLEKALDEVEAKDKPKEEEPRAEKSGTEEKPAKVEEAKAEETAAKPKTERDGSEAGRQSEGRDTPHKEPPARFTPEAREKWISAPREVRGEIHRLVQEYEREITEHKAFREDLKEYEDLAKQHNVTVKDTMQRYVAADRALNQNFGAGVAQLAQMYGHNPVQAIATIIQAHGITPQQYAEHVMKNPAAHVAPPRVQQPQQPQVSPEIDGIKQELDSLKHELAIERAQSQLTPVIQKFADEHPDYLELQDAIAKVLQDGVIDRIYGPGLSPEQKLAEAYRIAGGKPTSHAPQQQAEAADSEAEDVPSPIAGTKSVRGAPTGGKDPANKRFKSNRDAAAAALAELGI